MILTLYYARGACSLACHIALEETGAPYEARPVLIAEGENKTPAYLAIHPGGLVPVLDIDGARLTEAAAILIHIAQRFPQACLRPAAGSLAEARALELVAWLTNTLHIAYAGLWRPDRFTQDEAAGKAIVAEAKERIGALNGTIEERLKHSAFAGGDTYTIADPFLLVFFRWANRIGLDATATHPAWTAWARRMGARPAVARTLAKEGIPLFA
jgi:glutathione S-transferase